MAARRGDVDAEALVGDGVAEKPDDDKRFAETRAALANLVTTIRAETAVRNNLGLKANVALRVAEAALKRYPAPAG